MSPIRIDLNLKSESDVRLSLEFINTLSISEINLTHKNLNQPTFENAKLLKDSDLGLDIIQHLSVGLCDSLEKIENQIEKFKSIGVDKFLIVSGDQKRNIDSIDVINYLSNKNTLELYCVYNCALSDPEQIIEDRRLIQKLSNSNIKGVFIQLTDDLESLEKVIKKIRNINKEIKIYLTLIPPTYSALHKLKNNPWKGIKLSDTFLDMNNLGNAEQINSKLLSFAMENNLNILFEVMQFDSEKYQYLKSL